jgi:adenylate kinase family enzyme
MSGSLVILTGASGVGKTTLARAVQQADDSSDVFFFDSIGVPSAEVMATFGSGYQPGGAWQRAMTLQWIERLAPIARSERSVLFEGQMRISFIEEALATQQITNAHIILIECSDAVRAARLIHDREQPELASESMTGWARYLHEEAVAAGCEILDTGTTPLSEAVGRVLSYLNRR